MYSHFNSIKVRLELRREQPIAERLQFQFHKGTIRTLDTNNGRENITVFQFHKGTIRTVHPYMASVKSIQFQFHKGTIRTQYGLHRKSL